MLVEGELRRRVIKRQPLGDAMRRRIDHGLPEANANLPAGLRVSENVALKPECEERGPVRHFPREGGHAARRGGRHARLRPPGYAAARHPSQLFPLQLLLCTR